MAARHTNYWFTSSNCQQKTPPQPKSVKPPNLKLLFRAKPTAPNCKKTQIANFFTPLFITTYAISPPKKSPEFRSKAQVALNMEGAYCSRPERSIEMNMKIPAVRSIPSASFNHRRQAGSKHLKKQSQFQRPL